MSFSKICKALAPYCLVSLVAGLTHMVFIGPASFLLHNADLWIYPLASIDIALRGRGHIFPFDLNYGGMGLTIFRVLTLKVVNWFTNDPYILWERANLIFSYLVSPIAIAASVYFYLSRVLVRSSALLLGLFLAVGFNYSVFLFGLDTFPSLICGYCLILGIRGTSENPLSEFKGRDLFFVGLLLGFLTYVHRATILVAPAFIVSLPWLESQWHRARAVYTQPQKVILDSVLLGGALFFGLLAFYSNWKGRDLGTVFGKPILVDPFPNVKIALILMSVFFSRSLWSLLLKDSDLTRNHINKAALLGFGFLGGMIPEIISGALHNFTYFKPFSPTGNVTWSQLDQSLTALLWGPTTWQLIYNGAGKNLGCVFLAGGLVVLGGSWRRYRWAWPLVLLFAFNIFTFFRVRNSTEGAPHYLLSFYPFFYGILAVWWTDLRSKKNHALPMALFVTGLLLLAGFQVQQRMLWARDTADQKVYEQKKVVVSAVQKAGFDFVITSDHWGAVPFTVLSRSQPMFVSVQYLRIPSVSDNELCKVEKKVGAYFLQDEVIPHTMEVHGCRWNVSVIQRFGDRSVLALLQIIGSPSHN